MTIQPPHSVNDINKLNDMIQLLRNEGSIPPVLVHGEQAYSGSHRIAAWDALDMDVEYVRLTDAAYETIMTDLGLDPVYDCVYDFEPFLDSAKDLGFAGKSQ